MSEVFVYNGYADLTLRFNGMTFTFPRQKVTRVRGLDVRHPDEWKRNHPSDPDPQALLERNYTAKELTDQLFTRHGQNLLADQVIWVGDREPTPRDMERTNRFGQIRRRKVVEEALAERRSALAKGGKPDLDPQVVEWMVEEGMNDETYNPVPTPDLGTAMAEAFKAFAQQQQQQQQKPAGVR